MGVLVYVCWLARNLSSFGFSFCDNLAPHHFSSPILRLLLLHVTGGGGVSIVPVVHLNSSIFNVLPGGLSADKKPQQCFVWGFWLYSLFCVVVRLAFP